MKVPNHLPWSRRGHLLSSQIQSILGLGSGIQSISVLVYFDFRFGRRDSDYFEFGFRHSVNVGFDPFQFRVWGSGIQSFGGLGTGMQSISVLIYFCFGFGAQGFSLFWLTKLVNLGAFQPQN